MLKKLQMYFGMHVKGRLSSSEKDFLPAVLEVMEKPPSPTGRIVMWTIFLLITLGIIWSIFGHVDEVAVAPGKLIPVGSVKVVQAEDKGVVKAIGVQDGDKVTKGQLLMELDTTFSAADLARVKKELVYYNLEMERLMAEKTGAPFSPQTTAELDAKDLEFQLRLYQSRQSEFRAKLAGAESSIAQNQVSLEMAMIDRDKFQVLYDIAKDREERIDKLVAQNAVAMFVLLDYRSKRLELEQNLASQIANLNRLQSAITQSREVQAGVIAEHDRDIDTKLVEDRKQVAAYNEELKKTAEKERLSHITAPVDGRVTQLAVHTVGGVVTAAQPLMVIVPEDVTLAVESWVANKDIGFVHNGQQAEIKIETFSFQKYGTIDAVVVDVSPDAVEDKDKGRVYRVMLNLDKNNVLVGDKEVFLGPGMTASAEIKIRQKRIIEFFLDPFRRYQSEALRER
ncbi:HlyD family type I secretion periplasmic adaptor subunit [Pelosinus sp. UFO1]|uniref:HlyD family type I secretion periplasmic adaptor subunit n=1 Tax=Pelosinus sp. UFO1 TaxID=484770 RepID=UPI0004D0C2C6|nr:HlyD family type I secretion periplasmic adaptor subunit [Pelosinus sp. UFO1]AIF49857.1 type I secretion membrane fusion protein, HlyD family [Pelosinus sp. UFO1]